MAPWYHRYNRPLGLALLALVLCVWLLQGCGYSDSYASYARAMAEAAKQPPRQLLVFNGTLTGTLTLADPRDQGTVVQAPRNVAGEALQAVVPVLQTAVGAAGAMGLANVVGKAVGAAAGDTTRDSYNVQTSEVTDTTGDTVSDSYHETVSSGDTLTDSGNTTSGDTISDSYNSQSSEMTNTETTTSMTTETQTTEVAP